MTIDRAYRKWLEVMRYNLISYNSAYELLDKKIKKEFSYEELVEYRKKKEGF